MHCGSEGRFLKENIFETAIKIAVSVYRHQAMTSVGGKSFRVRSVIRRRRHVFNHYEDRFFFRPPILCVMERSLESDSFSKRERESGTSCAHELAARAAP